MKNATSLKNSLPQGAGCPVQHVLSVINTDCLTGVVIACVISPLAARDNKENVKEIRAYHITGFEGIAQTIRLRTAVWKKTEISSGILHDEIRAYRRCKTSRKIINPACM